MRIKTMFPRTSCLLASLYKIFKQICNYKNMPDICKSPPQDNCRFYPFTLLPFFGFLGIVNCTPRSAKLLSFLPTLLPFFAFGLGFKVHYI